MEFDYSPKVKDMQARLLSFMDEHIYPNEGRFFREIADEPCQGQSLDPHHDHRGTQAQGARRRTVEPVPAKIAARP